MNISVNGRHKIVTVLRLHVDLILGGNLYTVGIASGYVKAVRSRQNVVVLYLKSVPSDILVARKAKHGRRQTVIAVITLGRWLNVYLVLEGMLFNESANTGRILFFNVLFYGLVKTVRQRRLFHYLIILNSVEQLGKPLCNYLGRVFRFTLRYVLWRNEDSVYRRVSGKHYTVSVVNVASAGRDLGLRCQLLHDSLSVFVEILGLENENSQNKIREHQDESQKNDSRAPKGACFRCFLFVFHPDSSSFSKKVKIKRQDRFSFYLTTKILKSRRLSRPCGRHCYRSSYSYYLF